MDVYSEVIVSTKLVSDPEKTTKGLLTAARVFLVLGIFDILILIPSVILFILYFLAQRNLQIDYEYLHSNDEFDIDKVMGGAKRKKVMSFSLSQVELLAHWDAPELDDYYYIKPNDFSAKDWRDCPYVMICTVNGKKRKLYLQLSDEMLRTLKTRISSKMILKPDA